MKICVLPGEGIGPEVVEEAVKVIKALFPEAEFVYGGIGYETFQKLGTPLPGETIDKVRNSDATLFGAVTTPLSIPDYLSPIIRLRKEFELYANVRPCQNDKIDITIVRENTEGLYSGSERTEDNGNTAITERIITRKNSERIIRYAFDLAEGKNKEKVTVVHKANVLRETCGLFRKVALEVAKDYPNIRIEELLVDVCAMQLIKNPEKFDVIVTTNLFGDILSDEASMLVGGLGLAYSGNIGYNNAVFEPVHGSAPKYVGTHKINPMAAILSASMMLDYLGKNSEADKIRNAVKACIREKKVTQDLGGNLSTQEVTREIISKMAI